MGGRNASLAAALSELNCQQAVHGGMCFRIREVVHDVDALRLLSIWGFYLRVLSLNTSVLAGTA